MFPIHENFAGSILKCGFTLSVLLMPNIAAAKRETTLYSFTGTSGANPQSSLLYLGGTFYGTTYAGGAHKSGTVFEITPKGKEKTLYSFCSQQNCADGASPSSTLIADGSGNLYGTTYQGGSSTNCLNSNGCGTVFKISPRGVETVLYDFTAGSDGANPMAGLITDGAGNLYGTTYGDGNGSYTCEFSCGSVFKLAPNGVLTVLHDFSGGSDGLSPDGGLVADSSGNLYGTTQYGGGGGCGNSGCGTVFKIDTNNTETILYAFTGGNDGVNPEATMAIDSSNNLYGTTYAGGADNAGVVFELTANGAETVLQTFNGTSTGSNPTAGLIVDRKGNFYGTTLYGGEFGDGIVFKLTPSGSETVLYSFCEFEHCSDGANPYGGVVFDKSHLYGTTSIGGVGGYGTVFSLKK